MPSARVLKIPIKKFRFCGVFSCFWANGWGVRRGRHRRRRLGAHPFATSGVVVPASWLTALCGLPNPKPNRTDVGAHSSSGSPAGRPASFMCCSIQSDDLARFGSARFGSVCLVACRRPCDWVLFFVFGFGFVSVRSAVQSHN